MKRDLEAIAGKSFDLIVVGGGIVGAFTACDAARRGLSVLMVEAKDFGMATSEAMSHLVHGGLRYLAQGQVSMVMESLAERNRWRRFAPHHISPQPFLLPLGKKSGIDKRVGLALFEMLGRAAGGLQGKVRTQRLTRTEAEAMEPLLAGTVQAGAILYNDARVDAPERVVLSLVKDAVFHGATVANHMAVTQIRMKNGQVEGVACRDGLTGETLVAQAPFVVNCAGTFADRLLQGAGPSSHALSLTRSKGIHIITRLPQGSHGLALSGKGEHAFVVPVRGFSLIGTTDDLFEGDDPKADEGDIAGLTERLSRLLPAVGSFEILGSFAGVRALAKSEGPTYRAGRDIILVDHAASGCQGLFSLTGGKWTTARRMAEKLVDRIAARVDKLTKPCNTAKVPLINTPQHSVESVVKSHPTASPDRLRWLTQTYGTELKTIVADNPDFLNETHELQDQALFDFAMRHEMAVTPDDILHRFGRFALLEDPGLASRAAAWFAARP